MTTFIGCLWKSLWFSSIKKCFVKHPSQYLLKTKRGETPLLLKWSYINCFNTCDPVFLAVAQKAFLIVVHNFLWAPACKDLFNIIKSEENICWEAEQKTYNLKYFENVMNF